MIEFNFYLLLALYFSAQILLDFFQIVLHLLNILVVYHQIFSTWSGYIFPIGFMTLQALFAIF